MDLLPRDDREFIEQKLPKIVGWLSDDDAYLTAYLMNWQLHHAISGPALEFGVYHGKYLNLLLHNELKRDGWVGGFDIFEKCHPESAWRHAEENFGSRERMALWQENTGELNAADVLQRIGSAPRFISVDGDHSAKGSFHDLNMAAEILAERGIVAADDVFNFAAIGVAEGMFRFLFKSDCLLAPFAHIGNKTFLCRKEQHEFYLDAATSIATNCSDLGFAEDFQRHTAEDPSSTIQKLVGSSVAIFYRDPPPQPNE